MNIYLLLPEKPTNTIKAIKVKKKKPRRKSAIPPEIKVILEAIREKKGQHLTTIDLRNISDAVCDFFVICDVESSTQVKAIAEGIELKMKGELEEKPWHVEGIQHQEWILLDYVNVVVHVFEHSLREFYQLEELWSDGIIEEHKD